MRAGRAASPRTASQSRKPRAHLLARAVEPLGDFGAEARGDLEQRAAEVALAVVEAPGRNPRRARARAAPARTRRSGASRVRGARAGFMAGLPRGSRTGRRDCRSGWSCGRDTRSRPAACPRTVASSSTVTPSTSMRASQRRSASSTVGADPLQRRAVHRVEHQLVDAAAEIRPHHALARRGLEDDAGSTGGCPPRTATLATSPVRGSSVHRHRPAAAEKVLALGCQVVAHPIITVGAPTAIAFGAPASTTMSPCRAAGSPPIITVMLPTATTPPTCGFRPSTSGQACVSDAARHAGCPPISTVGQPGPGAERRAVARRDRRGVRQAVPSCLPQLMFTSAPRMVSVALALSSSVPVASIVIVAALMLSCALGLDRHRAAVAVDLDAVALLVLHDECRCRRTTTLRPFSCASSTTPLRAVVEQQVVLLARLAGCACRSCRRRWRAAACPCRSTARRARTGKRRSSRSKPTSTSSPTSGISTRPRSLPAIGIGEPRPVALARLVVPRDSCTFTRQSPSSSLFCVTIATATPLT